MTEEKSWTVSQYNRSVQRYLKDKVPKVWVNGVITQLNIRGRIAYITIGQFEEGNPKPESTLQVFLWTTELEAHNLRFSKLPTPFELAVELKVNVLLEADFYVPIGKFQPRVLSIDENFTLGELAQTRKKIIESLMNDGLMDKNKKLSLSPVPMKIGLITAAGSAAYKDFITTLEKSGFSFEIYFHPATMQGEQTEPTVLKAFQTLEKLSLDTICLIRGGGAKTDLIYFDSEKICRTIANCSYPVLTGIGHEIDQSIADLVAHSDKITPTDCAMFLKSRAALALDQMFNSQRTLKELWRVHIQATTSELASRADSLRYSWGIKKQNESSRIAAIAGEISSQSKRLIEDEKDGLFRRKIGLLRGPFKITIPEKERIISIKRLVQTQWFQHVTSLKEYLKLKSKLIKSADPSQQLKKGYSIIKGSGGKIIKGLSGIKKDDFITAETSDGFIESKVTSTRESK